MTVMDRRLMPEILDKQTFRETMSKFATGVAVLTTKHESANFGMTINSLTSVSLDPYQILVCINRGSPTGEAIEKSRMFAVSLLDREQKETAGHFVGYNAKRFSAVDCEPSDHGLPIVSGALACLVCEVNDIFVSGDHDIVIGNVVECRQRPGEPLVFFDGSYGSFSG